MRGCIFNESRFLTLKALKRANLRGAILPDNVCFDGILTHTEHLIKKARTVFSIALTLCITTLLTLLFSNKAGLSNQVNFSLPVINISLEIEKNTALIFYLVFLSLLTKFYVISFDTLKKQIDKLPAVFPDGRFAYETIFPWFMISWFIEMFQTSYPPENKIEKNLRLWRGIIISCIGDIFFVTVFTILMLLLNQSRQLITPIPLIGATSLAVVFFAITVRGAISSRSRFYAIIASIGTLITLGVIYLLTDYSYMLLVVFVMMIAWWWDRFIFNHDPLGLDLSYPDWKSNQDTLNKNFKNHSVRNECLNVGIGLLLCLIVALYLYHYRF